MYRLVLLCITWTAVRAGDDTFSIGLGVLAPSYSQKVGPGGAVQVDFNQKKNGYSYSVSAGASPAGAVKEQTAIAKDGLGGHTITHQAHASHTNPYSGETALKHNEQSFHINPYLGQAAVSTNNAVGQLNPVLGQAAFQQNMHNAQIAPGHTSLANSASHAAISPFGNSASHSLQAARADAAHGGVIHGAHTSHNAHSSVPGFGTLSHSSGADQQGFQGLGYGTLNTAGHNTNAAYDHYGNGQVNQAGFNNNQGYNAHLGVAGGDHTAFNRQASQDPYGNYGSITHSTHAAQAGHLGVAQGGYLGAAQGGYLGAAQGGYLGAAQGGYLGAAQAGHLGAAQGGYLGAAQAGHLGAAPNYASYYKQPVAVGQGGFNAIHYGGGYGNDKGYY